MNNKVTPVLEKALQDKVKGNYQKALRRLTEALEKHSDEMELYVEGADVCLEGGEPLQATHFLKKAYTRFSAEKERLDTFSREKLRKTGDPVLGKFLLELAIKRRELDWCCEILEDLQDRTVRELLQRTRTKKQTLTAAARGGYAIKSELVVNILSEALLCLRLGRMKAAVQAFIEILDDKPVENEVLEPFFGGLEKKYPKAGRIRYVYACSLIYTQQYDKAMSRLVQSVKMEPKIADEALERLRVLTEQFETPPPSVQDALVELLLAKGDVVRAGEILDESLANEPDQARRVMELLKPYVENVSDSLVLHYLYMEAALTADQTRRVLDKVNLIRRSEDHRDDLYQWLENKSTEQFLPAEIMIVHGEMALEAHHTSRAAEIFKAVFGSSPRDAQTVLAILEKHKDGNEKLTKLYDEQSEVLRANNPQQSDDGVEFEHFENEDFSFSSGPREEVENVDEPGPTAQDDKKAPERTVEPLELDPGPHAESRDDVEETEPAEPLEGMTSKSPLEIGLEQAAEAAARDGALEILWEEEDSDGVLDDADERSVVEDDDSWLVTQNDSIMGDEKTAASSPAETETVPASEAPEDATLPGEPEHVIETGEPENEWPAEEPGVDTTAGEPEDEQPAEEPGADTDAGEPENVTPA
ncbi:MAG: hypothetical protein PVF33_06130, partial [Candidatus Latescibacterota bacterium]